MNILSIHFLRLRFIGGDLCRFFLFKFDSLLDYCLIYFLSKPFHKCISTKNISLVCVDLIDLFVRWDVMLLFIVVVTVFVRLELMRMCAKYKITLLI